MSAAESVRLLARRCVSQSRRSRLRIDRACDDRMPSNECEYAGRSSFRLLLIKDRTYQILGHLLEMGRLHRVTGPAFGKRADRGGVTEHLRKRHLRMHNSQISTCFDAVDASTATI